MFGSRKVGCLFRARKLMMVGEDIREEKAVCQFAAESHAGMAPINRAASAAYWAPTPPAVARQRRFSELPLTKTKHGDGLGRRYSAVPDSSSSGGSNSLRHYIDPWDLENYAFIRRHSMDTTEYTTTPALESCSQSDFYYVPQYRRDDSLGLANGVEEEDFYNERYEMCCKSPFKPTSCLKSQTDAGDSYEDYDEEYSTEEGECALYSPSVLLRRCSSDEHDPSLVYVYETGSRRRKMVLPKRRSYTFRSEVLAESPDLYPYHPDSYMTFAYDELVPPYCDVYFTKPAPQNFGLSKYGHLKIDYSFSWNSLDRYIATE